MSQLIEYFAATNDRAAAAFVDKGPGDDGVSAPDLDPAVILASLESILTEVDEDVVLDNPRVADLVADDGDLAVYTVTDELRDALATSDSDQLGGAAEQLVELEELEGADPEMILGVLEELGELARRAVDANQRLYCWVSQ
ncbi:MAG TPA: hypothetical protein VHR85_15515 [Nocardioides sp.]|nr:hypothetical protein [Nocardioides sp.]